MMFKVSKAIKDIITRMVRGNFNLSDLECAHKVADGYFKAKSDYNGRMYMYSDGDSDYAKEPAKIPDKYRDNIYQVYWHHGGCATCTTPLRETNRICLRCTYYSGNFNRDCKDYSNSDNNNPWDKNEDDNRNKLYVENKAYV